MIRKIRNIIQNYRSLRGLIEGNTKEIISLKDDLNEREKKLIDRFANYERCVDRYLSMIDFRVWREKMNTNRFLYEEYLKNRKNQYKENFNPMVSIIMPVYNGSNYLKYAIDSALNQTYKNIEIIVVNDGSNDDGKTEAIAKSYGKKIRYLSKQNGGVSSALNEGIRNMKGEYFAWLSHDDIYYENHIEKNVEFLRYCDGQDIIPFSCFDIIDSEGKVNIESTISAGLHAYDFKTSVNTKYDCILKGEVNGGNVLIPKKAFDEFGGFEEGNRISQEKDMWARLLKKYKFINIPIITYSLRLHEKQVTSTTSNIIEETQKKIIEIIEGISEEEMINESRNVKNFYQQLYYEYKMDQNDKLADEMYTRYINL